MVPPWVHVSNKCCFPLLEGRKKTFCVGKIDGTVGIQPQVRTLDMETRHHSNPESSQTGPAHGKVESNKKGTKEARNVAPRAS